MHTLITHRLGKLVVAPLAALLLGLALAGSALAGGGPGGEAPAHMTFSPRNFALTPHGEVVLTGTMTCNLPGEAVVSAGVQEVAGRVVSDNPYDYQYNGLFVSGGNGVHLECVEPGTHAVTLTIATNAERGFRPGPARVFLDFDYVAFDPATGYSYPSSMFGILDITLQPTV
ncbi:MAG: hypothetical protein M3Q71_21835 [Chloroflexota bacterium]|nr:hypothetical protein [Chloroflexota bacterium]